VYRQVLINAELKTGNAGKKKDLTGRSTLTFWHRNYYFFILAHPVYKM
jgi:hypothetical protein